MARVTVGKINSRAARELLNSREMQQIVLEHAERFAANAGPGFVADVQPGATRARGMVKSTTAEGTRRQAESNVLLKAIR
jgi:hypothetical protein